MKKLTAGIFAGILAIITVNAANAEITSKAYVDGKFATKSDVANDVKDINDKIGTVTSGKTVVEMITAAQEAAIDGATYDDTEVKGMIADITKDGGTIDTKISANNGTLVFDEGTTDANKTVATAIAQAVTKAQTAASTAGTDAADAVDAKLGDGFSAENTVADAIEEITKEDGTIDEKIGTAISGLTLGTVNGDDKGVFTALTEANGKVGGTKSLIKDENVATDAAIAESKVSFGDATAEGTNIKSLIKKAQDAADAAAAAATTAGTNAGEALTDALGNYDFGGEGKDTVTEALAKKVNVNSDIKSTIITTNASGQLESLSVTKNNSAGKYVLAADVDTSGGIKYYWEQIERASGEGSTPAGSGESSNE